MSSVNYTIIENSSINIVLNVHRYEQTGRQIKFLILGGYFFASHPRLMANCRRIAALHIPPAIVTIRIPSTIILH